MSIEFIASIDKNTTIWSNSETEAKHLAILYWLEDTYYTSNPELFYRYTKMYYDDYAKNPDDFLACIFNKSLFIWKAHY